MITDFIIFELSKIDWTAISAIITALMMIATLITVYQNHLQVKRLKEQWDEENRPKVYPRIIVYNKAYFLEFFNAGKSDAVNVLVTIGTEFINHLPSKSKGLISNWNGSPFFIKSSSSKYAFIGWCEEINKDWADANFKLDIHGSYNNGAYILNYSEHIQNFINKKSMVVLTPIEHALEKLADGLVRPNRLTHLDTVQEQLEDISTSINKIANYLQKNNGTKQDK